MGISPLQILLIVLVILVIFGAGKLPKVMGDVGKGMKNFKKGLNDKDDDDEAKPEPTKKDDKSKD